MPQDFARPDSQIFRAYYVQQRRKKRKGGVIPPFVDPVAGSIVGYRMDGNDSSFVPIMSPTIVTGLDLPDLKATEFNGVDQYIDASADSAAMATIGSGAFTIVFRIKTAIANARTIIKMGDDTLASGFKINVRGVGGIALKIDNISLNFGDSRFLDDIWLHVIMTSTGTGGDLDLYVDNVANGTTRTLPAYNITDTNDFMIAAANLPATIDGIWAFDFALDASQRSALFNNT